MVEPTAKLLPDLCVASTSITVPLSSIADGASQNTGTRAIPSSADFLISNGQLMITGGEVSTYMYELLPIITEKNEHM